MAEKPTKPNMLMQKGTSPIKVYVDHTTGRVFDITDGEWFHSRVSDWERSDWKFVTYHPNKPVLETEGVKFDQDKLPYHLIAPEMLEGTAQVLGFGSVKYAPRNWEKGMDWSRPFGALMRHMWAWWRGEDKDPETGYSHIDHALCCLMFLKAYESRNIGKDDRPNEL